jgi:hypothetical protein
VRKKLEAINAKELKIDDLRFVLSCWAKFRDRISNCIPRDASLEVVGILEKNHGLIVRVNNLGTAYKLSRFNGFLVRVLNLQLQESLSEKKGIEEKTLSFLYITLSKDSRDELSRLVYH